MARILVVDDEEYVRRFYAEELSEEGHEVNTVSTGYELLRKIRNFQPDVVVLDIMLVDYDGLELLQDIRNRHYDLPVILSSAYDSYKYDKRSIAADYYVIKSFDLSELKRKIKMSTESSIITHMKVS